MALSLLMQLSRAKTSTRHWIHLCPAPMIVINSFRDLWQEYPE